MKARGYAQVIIDRNSAGRARAAKIQRVTTRYPRDPLPGAFIVALAIEIPDVLANVQTVEAAADAGLMTLVLEPEE